MPQRIRLLATCQINGAVHHAGEIVTLPDGQRGPYRTAVASDAGAQITAHRYAGQIDADASYNEQNLVDVPMFEVVDEGVEKERDELRARHAQERDKFDRNDERAALVRKQAEETAAFELKAADTGLKTRQEQEAKTLKDRQTAESAAFDKRAETPLLANPPVETSKEDLDLRHKLEAEALEKKHAEDTRVLEGRKARVVPAGEQTETMTDAELAAWNRSHGRPADDQNERLQRNNANAQRRAAPLGPLPPRMPARAAFEAPSPVPIGAPSRP